MDYAYQDEAHHIDFLESQTPWGYVLAQKLSLGGKTPFKATGHVHFIPMNDIVVDGEISGSLLNLALDANLRLKDVPSKAKANLRLWEDEWLTVTADLDAIDPKAWQASLPAGRFAIRAAASVRNDIYRVDITAKMTIQAPLTRISGRFMPWMPKDKAIWMIFILTPLLAILAKGRLQLKARLAKAWLLILISKKSTLKILSHHFGKRQSRAKLICALKTICPP